MTLPSLFYLLRHTPRREALLTDPLATPKDTSYLFYGLQEFQSRGWQVACNLPRPPHRPVPHFLEAAINWGLKKRGHIANDFYSPLCFFRALNSSDLIFATNDSVGLAPLWLRRLGLLRTPVVYTSIGMPERLACMAPKKAQACLNLLGYASAIVCYGWEEAEHLRTSLENIPQSPKVHFVPFGVNTSVFPPRHQPKTLDILSIGADRMRDPVLLMDYLRERPHLHGMLVHSMEHALPSPPKNLCLRHQLPMEELRSLIASSRVVALPVKENSYSGATTTLLQSLSMGAAVLVARTGAIRQGYHLEDQQDLCFYPPGDAAAFGKQLDRMLEDDGFRMRLGAQAMEKTHSKLDQSRFIDQLSDVFMETLHVKT